ncbi:MAG: histidine--tRNA ligase [Cystobacterineae bacterium]|nr:histidine--tRNA ligase [Cystobacterineae bacterium]
MKQKFSGLRGMGDILPPDTVLWQRLEATAREIFGAFGFGEIRTPIAEETALFERGIGEDTEVIGKEMYSFLDKGDRHISLRPEGTAPVVRSYIEHAIHQREPISKWFYMGPMFRYERMKTGRYRQFHQLGAEVFGIAEPRQDAELIQLALEFLKKLGIFEVRLELNSLGDVDCRRRFAEKTHAHFSSSRHVLSEELQKTLDRNPMRLLDSKEERMAPLIASAPILLEQLDDASREHFDELQRLLRLLEIDFVVNPRLVRGLDYYSRTAFEVVAEASVLGTASTVCGGGRYDALVEQLGGPSTPAVGFAMGLERLCLLMGAKSKAVLQGPLLFLVDAGARDEVWKLLSFLRKAGLAVEADLRGGSVKSQLKRANKLGAQYCIVLGEAELKTGQVQLKDMQSGTEREVMLSEVEGMLR